MTALNNMRHDEDSPVLELVDLLKDIHRTLKTNGANDQLAYSVPQLAARVSLSDEQIYKHIANGDLMAKYSGSKKLIPVAEAQRFVENLPDEYVGPL